MPRSDGLVVDGAQLVGSAEFTFSTDFAILVVKQPDVDHWGEDPGVYANSWPGFVQLTPGARYADPTVRLERWSARPPRVGQEWEDVDELPFEEVPGAGRLQAHGFDPPADPD